MNKISKYAGIAFFGLVALLSMASCTKDDYSYDTPAALEGAQVYFSNTLPSQYEISTTANSFNIPLNRQNTSGSVTVPLTYTPDDGSIFSVPSEVTFADGDSVANIAVSYDPSKIVYGDYKGGTIEFDSAQYSTPFGSTSYTFTAGASSYVDMPGTGLYRDNLIAGLYSIDNEEWAVKIQENSLDPGMYKVIAPYAQKGWNYYNYYDASATNTDIEINAKDSDAVYFSGFDSGVTLGSDGDMHFISYAQYYIENGRTIDWVKQNHPDWLGTMRNGVITMPAKSAIVAFNGTDWQYITNSDGLFRVALPGAVVKDYSATGAYVGRFTDDNDNDFAEVSVSWGADVNTVRYALVPSTANVEATVKGITDGSIKSTEIASAATVRVPYTDSGDYNFIIVEYENGEQVGYEVVPMTLRSSKETVEQYKTVYAGAFAIGVRDMSQFVFEEPFGKTFPEAIGSTAPYTIEAEMQQSQSNPTHFKITPYFKDGYDFYFTYDSSTGEISVKNVDSGISDGSENIIVTDIANDNNITEAQAKSYGLGNTFSNNTFTFTLVYKTSEGYYGCERDQFTISESAAKALRNAAKRAKAHKKSFKHVSSSKAVKKSNVRMKFFKAF